MGIPLVALAGQQPQIENPQDFQLNAARLRAAAGEDQLRQQQLQAGDLELQQKQQALKDQQAQTAAWQQWDHKNPDDLTSLIVKNGGSGAAASAMQQSILGIRAKAAEAFKNNAEGTAKDIESQQKMHDDIRGRLMAIIAAPEDQKNALWDAEVTKEEQAGTVQPGSISHTYPGDDQAKVFASQHALGSVLAKEAVEQQNADTKKLEEQNRASQLDLETKKFNATMPGGPLEDVSKAEMNDWLKKNPTKGPSDFLAWKAKQAPLANFNLQMAAGGGLTQTALDQQAEKYYTTGQLPPGGRGAAGLAQNRMIMNRAAQLHPEGVLAASSAEYKANADSLKTLQKSFDQVSAFETTANKNLDLFTSLAQKAIDSGIPLLNAPLRSGATLLGDKDQAALNTARQVAINEIAKVTSNPGLSGQLSDSARHEIEAFNPASATYGQTMAVAKVLKQDMANRHQSYADQINDIKRRIGGAPPASNTGNSNQTAPSSGLAVGDTVKIKGKQMKVTAVHPDGSFDAQ